MHSTLSIIKQLSSKYPDIKFVQNDNFLWSPSDKTVYYAPARKDSDILLLHEVSHALLNHTDYSRDIQLVKMESEAWDQAVLIGPDFGVIISDSDVQSNLDTYRDWLHARSTCPNCQANGVQDKPDTYKCLACGHTWRVNEARICELRRYKSK